MPEGFVVTASGEPPPVIESTSRDGHVVAGSRVP